MFPILLPDNGYGKELNRFYRKKYILFFLLCRGGVQVIAFTRCGRSTMNEAVHLSDYFPGHPIERNGQARNKVENFLKRPPVTEESLTRRPTTQWPTKPTISYYLIAQ